MIAASSKPLNDASDRNANNSNCMNATGNVANGPTPSPASAIANAATAAISVVEPRAPNRKPAQPTIGKNTNATGTSRVAKKPHNPNINCDAANSVRNNASPSPIRFQVQSNRRP